MCRCGTCGLVVGLVVLGLGLDSMILELFSNLHDSIIPGAAGLYPAKDVTSHSVQLHAKD